MRNQLRRIVRNPLFAALYLPGILLNLSRGLLDPVLPLYARSMGSYGLVGLALAAEGFGTLLFDVPSGLVAGRLGRRRAMLLGLAGGGLSSAALFWTQSIPQVIAFRLAYGAFSSIYNVSVHVYATDRIKVAGRGRSLSMLGGTRRIGALAGPLLGGAIAAKLGLRAPFLVIAAISAGTMLLVMRFVEDGDAGRRSRLANPASAHPVSYSKARYGVWTAAGIAQMLGQMIRAARKSIIPLYAADVLGLDVGLVGVILGAAAALDVTVFPVSGLIMDRWGRKFVTVPTFGLQGLGILLVPFAHSFMGLLATAMAIGLGNGIGAGSMMTLGSDLAPVEGRARFLGAWRLMGDAGGTASPVLVGTVAQLFVLPAAATIIAVTGFLATATFYFFVPETLRRADKEAA